MVLQRAVGISLGYEELNDHDELRHSVCRSRQSRWKGAVAVCRARPAAFRCVPVSFAYRRVVRSARVRLQRPIWRRPADQCRVSTSHSASLPPATAGWARQRASNC